jgi:hypothetical protein
MVKCTKCQQTFSCPSRLRKHANRDHRGPNTASHHFHKVPDEIPSDVRDLSIRHFYPVGGPIPAGFSKNDLPLIRVRYLLTDGTSCRGYCSYQTIRDSFPGELCDYYFPKIVFVKGRDKDTKA